MTSDRDIVERLRRTLGGVQADAFGGDNLAIFLASEFEPGVEDDELDESETWKQGAIVLTDQVLDAIHQHYAPEITRLRAENERLRAALSFYANPEVYKPHPHGAAFDRRDLSYHAIAAIRAGTGRDQG